MFFDPMSLESDDRSRDYGVKNQENLCVDMDEAWGTGHREWGKRCFFFYRAIIVSINIPKNDFTNS